MFVEELFFPPLRRRIVIDEEVVELTCRLCTRCGTCCTTSQPELFDEDIVRLARKLNMSVKEFIDKYCEIVEVTTPVVRVYPALKSPCPFFDRDRKICTIYSDRPLICRTYPIYIIPDIDLAVIVDIGVCSVAKTLINHLWRVGARVVEHIKLNGDSKSGTKLKVVYMRYSDFKVVFKDFLK